MIPKIVHFYWGGSTHKLSWLRYMTLYSFKKLNPDWLVKLYVVLHKKDKKRWSTGEMQDSFDFTGMDYWDRLPGLGIEILHNYQFCDSHFIAKLSPVQASDIFSWHILASEGGLYADMDILFINPIAGFYNSIRKCNTALCLIDQASWLPIGFMASAGNDPLFRDALAMSVGMVNNEYQSAGIDVLRTLCGRNYRNFYSRYPTSKLLFFDKEVVYHWLPEDHEHIYHNDAIELPGSVGIHWYGGAPLSHTINNTINEQNYKESNHILSFYMSRLLA